MPKRLLRVVPVLILSLGCSQSPPAPASAPSGSPPVIAQAPATTATPADSSTASQPAPAGDQVAEELAKLEGTWQTVAMESDGSALTPDELKKFGSTATFLGNKVTAQKGEKVTVSLITIDPSRSPKWIEWMAQDDNPDQGKTMLGIYEVDGDTLKICITKPGTERPIDFTTRLGEPRMLAVYERQK